MEDVKYPNWDDYVMNLEYGKNKQIEKENNDKPIVVEKRKTTDRIRIDKNEELYIIGVENESHILFDCIRSIANNSNSNELQEIARSIGGMFQNCLFDTSYFGEGQLNNMLQMLYATMDKISKIKDYSGDNEILLSYLIQMGIINVTKSKDIINRYGNDAINFYKEYKRYRY